VNLTTQAIKSWAELFAEYSVEHFHAALQSAVRKPGQQFFPTPGQVQAELNTLCGIKFAEAGIVWEQLLRFAASGYPLGQVLESLGSNDPAKSALRQVGYDVIRLADIESELPWKKKEFISAYKEFQEKYEQTSRVEISHEQSKKLLNLIPGADKIKALK
jgi:hypothetical protein